MPPGIVTFFVSDRYSKIVLMNLVFLLYTAMLFVAHAMAVLYDTALRPFFVIGLGTKSFDALVNANVSEISRPERRGMFSQYSACLLRVGRARRADHCQRTVEPRVFDRTDVF